MIVVICAVLLLLAEVLFISMGCAVFIAFGWGCARVGGVPSGFDRGWLVFGLGVFGGGWVGRREVGFVGRRATLELCRRQRGAVVVVWTWGYAGVGLLCGGCERWGGVGLGVGVE